MSKQTVLKLQSTFNVLEDVVKGQITGAPILIQ